MSRERIPLTLITGFLGSGKTTLLAKLLRDNYYIVNRSGSGTVTHLAPELFQVGSRITAAVERQGDQVYQCH